MRFVQKVEMRKNKGSQAKIEKNDLDMVDTICGHKYKDKDDTKEQQFDESTFL